MGRPHEDDYDDVEEYERDLHAWEQEQARRSEEDEESNNIESDPRNRFRSQDNEDYTPPMPMPR